ncbi:MAG: serine hydrolase [Actinomycetes bacterium]
MLEPVARPHLAAAAVTSSPISRRTLLAAGLATGSAVVLGAAPSRAASVTGVRLPAGVSAGVTFAAPWVARHGLDSAAYQDAFNAYQRQGYRPIHVAGYDTSQGARYAAIWEQTSGPAWQARHGLTAEQHQATFDALVAQGYRLRSLSGYTDGGRARFASVWERSGGPAFQARHGLDGAAYQVTFTDLANRGYRLRSVSGYTENGVVRYAAFWEQAAGPAWQARHGQTTEQHQASFDQLTGQGYRPVYVAGYATPSGPRFASIYEQSDGRGFDARHGLTGTTYQEAVDVWALWGLRPATVGGYQDGAFVRYATIWLADGPSSGSLLGLQGVVDRFVSSHALTASQLAIAKDGRLLYARAFGTETTASPSPATRQHRFRIASVSKPITSAAIFALVDAGRLTLDQHVFGQGALLGTTYGTKPYGEHLRAITVRHLLTHSVGTWANDGSDPMFLDKSLPQTQVITRTIDDRPPTSAPGSAYAYSNFGYCLLGRVIEAASGQPYADYVRALLARTGVTRAELGGNTRTERLPFEVEYQGRGGEDPYAMNVRRMDAHGGWIATASDLVRFALAVDGRPSPPDVLTAASQATMDTPSAANARYAHGWSVTDANRWHNGSLPGTTSILVRTGTAMTWAGLLNTRDATLGNDLDAMMWEAVGKVSRWPSGALSWP